MPFRDARLTSVPAGERPLAVAELPGARVDPGRLAEPSDARVLVVSYSDRLDPALLARFPRLEAVVTRSDGFDHLPEAWMRERGLPGYHLGDYAAPAVAEWTVAMLIALLRRVPEAAERTRALSWSRAGLESRALRDATVGILGVGRIGSRVARDLSALGARTLGHDLVMNPAMSRVPGFLWADGLDDLLRRSDALTIHVPLTDATRGMLGAREMSTLPAGAVVVNSARGDVVDHKALAAALDAGWLGGYAADVLPGEPDPAAALTLLARRAHVLLTPHVASYDAGTLRERYRRSARIARALLEGRPGEVGAFRCV